MDWVCFVYSCSPFVLGVAPLSSGEQVPSFGHSTNCKFRKQWPGEQTGPTLKLLGRDTKEFNRSCVFKGSAFILEDKTSCLVVFKVTLRDKKTPYLNSFSLIYNLVLT